MAYMLTILLRGRQNISLRSTRQPHQQTQQHHPLYYPDWLAIRLCFWLRCRCVRLRFVFYWHGCGDCCSLYGSRCDRWWCFGCRRTVVVREHGDEAVGPKRWKHGSRERIRSHGKCQTGRQKRFFFCHVCTCNFMSRSGSNIMSYVVQQKENFIQSNRGFYCDSKQRRYSRETSRHTSSIGPGRYVNIRSCCPSFPSPKRGNKAFFICIRGDAVNYARPPYSSRSDERQPKGRSMWSTEAVHNNYDISAIKKLALQEKEEMKEWMICRQFIDVSSTLY